MAKVRGQQELMQNLRRVEFAVREALEITQREQAEDLLSLASDRAPQLTDRLVESGGVDSETTPDLVRSSVFFDTEYAVIQHEGIFNPGPKTSAKLGTARGIGRKYLQKPFEENARRYIEEQAQAANRAIRLVLR